MLDTPARILFDRRQALAIAVLIVIGTAISLVRVPWQHHDIVWAEDGTIFLSENLNDGFWATLARGYAGYQQFLPRIIAGAVIPTVPLDGYAIAVFWVSCFVIGLVGAAVFWLSRDVIPWAPARFTLGLLTFVIPLSTQEVIGNLADIHTYALWLAPWLFFYRPRSWPSAVSWSVVAFVVTTTEVQALLFLPLALVPRWRRDLRMLPIPVGFLIGAIWQVVTVLTVPRHSTPGWPGIPSLVDGWLINTVLPLVVSNPMTVKQVLSDSGLILPYLIVIPFVLAGIAALIWGTGTQRLLVATLVVASFAIYAAGATVDGTWWFRYADADAQMWERALNVRYGVASGLMLTALVPVAVAIVRARFVRATRGRTLLQIACWSILIILVLVMARADTRAVSIRGWVDGPWSVAVQHAQDLCRSAEPGHRVAIPIAPFRHISLSCTQLMKP